MKRNRPNKLLIGILSENRSMAAAMLARLAQDYGWEADIVFIPPQMDLAELQERVASARPNFFALSFRSYERHQAFRVAAAVKSMGIKVIAGGFHPSAMPQDLIRSGHFDAIVQGDGMGVLDTILDNYNHFENGQIIKGKRHHDKSAYLRYFFTESQKDLMKNTGVVNMLTSIGCPFSCKYCGSSRMDYFMIPEEDLVANMIEYVVNYGIKIFTFQDDLLCASLKRLRSICALLNDGLAKHGLSNQEIGFGKSINARASSFNEEIAAELVRMGVTDVSFGIESSSTKLLNFLNKKQKQEDCYRAIELCRKYGLYSRVNLMFGVPTQDRDDYEASLKFVEEARPEIANLFYFTPYPGTDLYDYCFDNGYIPEACDRNSFDWFEPEIDGIRQIQFRLKNIDYDLATSYMDQISNIYDVNHFLHPLLKDIDRHPWVLVGSSVQIYFSQIINHLKKYDLKNYLGHWDVDPDASYSIAKRVDDKIYRQNADGVPISFVTYCHTTGRDFHNFKNMINEKFGDVPLISISTMKRHTADEISRMIMDRLQGQKA